MGILAYLIAGIVLVSALAGLAAYERKAGGDSVRVEWEESNTAARQKAEAERIRQDALRQAQDKEATRRLANEKKRTGELMVSLEAHIKAAGLRTDCRITPELLGDANSALAGSQGLSTGTVPSPAKPPSVAR